MPFFQQFVLVACFLFFLQVLYTVLGHLVQPGMVFRRLKEGNWNVSSKHHSSVFLANLGHVTLFARDVLDCISSSLIFGGF